METVQNSHLIWVDIETTGLDLGAVPLEISVTVTDGELNFLGNITGLIKLMPVDELQELCDDFVLEMHTKNGLWDDLRKYGGSPPLVVDANLMDWFATFQAGVEPKACPLVGSTINFDRRILAAHFPDFHDFLHYRNIDVSSIKELCRRWAPTVYDNRPNQDESLKTHRAKMDIAASIEELHYYREKFFNLELVR